MMLNSLSKIHGPTSRSRPLLKHLYAEVQEILLQQTHSTSKVELGKKRKYALKSEELSETRKLIKDRIKRQRSLEAAFESQIILHLQESGPELDRLEMFLRERKVRPRDIDFYCPILLPMLQKP